MWILKAITKLNHDTIYLWAHVFNCATHSHFDRFPVFQVPGEAEINYSEVVIILPLCKDNVERFYVQMDETLGMNVLDTAAYLTNNCAAFGLGEYIVLQKKN